MLALDIPGRDPVVLEHLLLDVNGTIASGGALIHGVTEALAELEDTLHIVVITADTHGTATALAMEAGVELRVIVRGEESAQKRAVLRELGTDQTVVIGNGANDALALKEAAVAIAVIGDEGASRMAIDAADVVVTDIHHALRLLLDPRRLVATLRS